MHASQPESAPSPADEHVEEIEVRGHIIDSLILPKILDCITTGGGAFRIKRIVIGQARNDPSYALVEVSRRTTRRSPKSWPKWPITAPSPRRWPIVGWPRPTSPGHFPKDSIAPPINGPRSASAAIGLPSQIKRWIAGSWSIRRPPPIPRPASAAEPAPPIARCIPMTDVRVGMPIVVGHAGTRVFPHERSTERQAFEFMNSPVSTEKPKGVAIRQIAQELFRIRAAGGQSLLVGGPAIIHTGSGQYVCELLRKKYIHRLFAGNALATHDIEQALFGTSLGVHLDRGDLAEAGHEHHLRAINRIRRAGGIRQAVEQGILKSGIMYECVHQGVDYLLAGSIRDDGPLPDVITDVLEAQRRMRAKIRDISFCLMIATTLHSIAVGNLLPAWVKVVCVDINPSTVIKLNDRGSFQTVGLVTDVEPFLRALVEDLSKLEEENA